MRIEKLYFPLVYAVACKGGLWYNYYRVICARKGYTPCLASCNAKQKILTRSSFCEKRNNAITNGKNKKSFIEKEKKR